MPILRIAETSFEITKVLIELLSENMNLMLLLLNEQK